MAEKVTYADQPWKKNYFLGPFKLRQTMEPYPDKPVYHILDDAAREFPGNVACICGKDKILYQDLKLKADSLATALADFGVKKGDRVVTLLPNCIQFIPSDFGISKAGSVHVLCNPGLPAEELEYIITVSGAHTIIILDEYLNILEKIRDKTNLKNIIVTWRTDSSSNPVQRDIPPGMYRLTDLFKDYEPDPPEIEFDVKKDLAMLYFTSGTTGRPKGIMLTHYGRMATLMATFPWILEPLAMAVRGKASIEVPVALGHSMGHSMVEAAVHMAMRILLVSDPNNADEMVALLKEHRPLIFVSYPMQLVRMLPKMGRAQTMVLTAGALLPRSVAQEWKKVTGMPVSQIYGCSEGGTTLNLSAFSKITGFMPHERPGLGVPTADVDVKLLDSETKKEVPIGDIGEVYFKGPAIMIGYWPTPGSGLNDGWLSSGDLARMDEDGYMYLVDRVKDTINIEGFIAYSADIDEVLHQHPAVAIAATIGIPDPERRGSEKVKAFVELRPEHKGKVTAEEIIEHCKLSNLPPYAIPTFVEFRDEIPLTATHKPFKKQLRAEEKQRREEEEKKRTSVEAKSD